jgi:hypothetical protein
MRQQRLWHVRFPRKVEAKSRVWGDLQLEDDVSDLDVLEQRSGVYSPSDFLENGGSIGVVPRLHGLHELRQGFIRLSKVPNLLLQLAVFALERGASRLGLLGGICALARIGGATRADGSLGIALDESTVIPQVTGRNTLAFSRLQLSQAAITARLLGLSIADPAALFWDCWRHPSGSARGRSRGSGLDWRPLVIPGVSSAHGRLMER